VAIDLHVHSTASDGTESPAVVVAQAAAAGLRAIALTDHDTTAGWAEASTAAAEHGIGLVPGIELSCHVRGISVHLLAYLPDPEHAGLRAVMDRVRDDRVDRLRRMAALIAEDHPLTWDDVLAQVGSAGGVAATVGRPHLADALVANGVVADRDEAFATLLHRGSPYYVPHYAPEGHDLVDTVVAAGGVAVIAHPRAGQRGRVLDDAQVASLAGAGMAGLEVDHRDHTPSDRAALRELAARLGLFVTGSSDYHGTGKTNRLGENVTAAPALERILELGRGTKALLP